LYDNIEEFDKLKTKILKYIMYKKRTEKEVIQKFSSSVDQNLLEDVIEHLKEIG
jgi:SOS response regulatory protein OraA/RecX